MRVFRGGAQLGYNWQYDRIVLGIEADVQGASVGGATTTTTLSLPPTGGGITLRSDNTLDAFATVRGRVGAAFDRVLIYGTGGYAIGRNTFNGSTDALFVLNGQVISTHETRHDSAIFQGWVAGGGIEYAVAEKWSVKAEYLHFDFGTKTTLDNNTDIKLDFDLLRLGVNYRF